MLSVIRARTTSRSEPRAGTRKNQFMVAPVDSGPLNPPRWVGVFALLSIAIVGCNTCLNPQPDLPSCGESDSGSVASGGTLGAGGTFGAGGRGSSAAGASVGGNGGSSNLNEGMGGNASGNEAGSSGDFAGAGGDSAVEPGGSEGGAAGAIDDDMAGAGGNREP